MKLISIIIPFYKKIDYIEKTILSILNQTYENFEVIIVYDDQNFQELNLLQKIINDNKKIKLLINNKNLGASYSRNLAMKKAKGDYIAFIDADDLWKKDKLQAQINFMKKNNLECCHTNYEIIDKKDRIIAYRIARNFLKVDDLIKSCDIGLSTVIISKKIKDLNLQFPNLKTKEDFVLWLSILKHKIPIIAFDKNLTSWRKVDNSLSTSVLQKLLDAFKVYNRYMNFNFIKSIYYVLCLSINFLKK
ncbi:glycosyltransferase family 2 protein [Candidatus Pelagibacter sp.]|nr:glycosyltransferase family 2 protein [Candidatus Pelagibacter sp.]